MEEEEEEEEEEEGKRERKVKLRVIRRDNRAADAPCW